MSATRLTLSVSRSPLLAPCLPIWRMNGPSAVKARIVWSGEAAAAELPLIQTRFLASTNRLCSFAGHS